MAVWFSDDDVARARWCLWPCIGGSFEVWWISLDGDEWDEHLMEQIPMGLRLDTGLVLLVDYLMGTVESITSEYDLETRSCYETLNWSMVKCVFLTQEKEGSRVHVATL